MQRTEQEAVELAEAMVDLVHAFDPETTRRLAAAQQKLGAVVMRLNQDEQKIAIDAICHAGDAIDLIDRMKISAAEFMAQAMASLRSPRWPGDGGNPANPPHWPPGYPAEQT